MNTKRFLFLFLVALGIAGLVIGANVYQNQLDQQHDAARYAARARAEQQIASDRLNPMSFQSRCGLASSHRRDGRSFMISYPAENVAVSFLSDKADSTSFKRVDYWSIQPLVPITLSQAVSRLDCSPRP